MSDKLAGLMGGFGIIVCWAILIIEYFQLGNGDHAYHSISALALLNASFALLRTMKR